MKKGLKWDQKFRKSLSVKEWDLYLRLCWEYLNFHNFKDHMQHRPNFEIVDQGPFLGAYSATTNKKGLVRRSTILIHKKALLLPKEDFMDVLLHEMAHQYCFEHLKKPHRKHTKLWKKVCRECGARSCG